MIKTWIEGIADYEIKMVKLSNGNRLIDEQSIVWGISP
jgi:hypothetical protein